MYIGVARTTVGAHLRIEPQVAMARFALELFVASGHSESHGFMIERRILSHFPRIRPMAFLAANLELAVWGNLRDGCLRCHCENNEILIHCARRFLCGTIRIWWTGV